MHDAIHLSNLPLPLSSFVGRAEALTEIQQLLHTSRLVTLTGSAGVGKTRLAQETGATMLGHFRHGVWWVDLAPLADGELVPHAVALALGLGEDPSCSRLTGLSESLQDRELLLILDNCEHLIAGCAELAYALLSTCPTLHILTTSREALGLNGETIWPVPPLSLPDLDRSPDEDVLDQSEAGQLFLARARAVEPSFEVTQPTAQVIAEVCHRLDGVPLAIELAAAWVRVLPVAEINTRLDQSLQLLSLGSRSGSARHQKLEAAIDWSYELLTEAEQQLLRHLAVFAGSFTLEAVEAVMGTSGEDGESAGREDGIEGQDQEILLPGDVLELLAQLVNKSLVLVRKTEQRRYDLLGTIRQYAQQKLLSSGEGDGIQERHLGYYLKLAEAAEAEIRCEEQLAWLVRLRAEEDNLRVALAWSLEQGDSEAALRLAAALGSFWNRMGLLSEGSYWLERALAADRSAGPVRAQALHQAARLAQQRGEYAQALALAGQSLTLGRELEDKRIMARALSVMGFVAHWQGDRDRGGQLLEEGLALARESGDESIIGRALLYLGDLRLRQGAHDEADPLLQESLATFQRLGDGWSIAWAFDALGDLARLRGDYRRAAANLQLGLMLYQELDSQAEIPRVFEVLALTAVAQGAFQRAVKLWGAAEAQRDAVQAHLPWSYEADYAPHVDRARSALGEEAFVAAWAEGRAMTLDQAITLAMAAEPAPAAAPSVPGKAPQASSTQARQYGLTPREVEVLGLVATGLTDAEVAQKLVISARTVSKHLQSVYSKLYLPSRSAATRWAIEHHLA